LRVEEAIIRDHAIAVAFGAQEKAVGEDR